MGGTFSKKSVAGNCERRIYEQQNTISKLVLRFMVLSVYDNSQTMYLGDETFARLFN